jgi:AAA ATPase-like protein
MLSTPVQPHRQSSRSTNVIPPLEGRGTIRSHESRMDRTGRKMISSFHIEGYRGFPRLDITGLGQVNLMVGKNNSGKTSVLEALHLLTSRGDGGALWQLLWRRGERYLGQPDAQRPQPEGEVSHLFTGHELHVGARFKLRTRNETPENSIVFEVVELSPKEQPELFGGGAGDDFPLPFQRLGRVRLFRQYRSLARAALRQIPLTLHMRNAGHLSTPFRRNTSRRTP